MDLVGNLPAVFLLIGALLIIAEAAIPGAQFIVLGVAMFFAGLISIALPTTVYSPAILAVLTLGFAIIAFWLYQNFDLYGSANGQTRDSAALVGEKATVVTRVTETDGRIDLLGENGFSSTYSARCSTDELPEGTTVVITDGRGGNVVTVEPVDE